MGREGGSRRCRLEEPRGGRPRLRAKGPRSFHSPRAWAAARCEGA
ncbi:hypothetical protein HMPREF1248_1003 [Coriobacteriaceae bacterium BV3Ac1]|nr:hypothetical protein HMPREF1248_1003 [Coriobacteriaceae bacterium BV3Ac1]